MVGFGRGLENWRLESVRAFQLVASVISLATSFYAPHQNSFRTHFAAPHFRTGFAAQPFAALPPYGCGVPHAVLRWIPVRVEAG